MRQLTGWIESNRGWIEPSAKVGAVLIAFVGLLYAIGGLLALGIFGGCSVSFLAGCLVYRSLTRPRGQGDC